MEKEQNNEPISTSSSNEIGTIRSILMGDHIAYYKARFQAMDERMDLTDATNDKKRQELERMIDERFIKLEEKMLERMNELEKLIRDNTQLLNQKMQQSSVQDKAVLGQMLADISSRLMKG